MKKPSFLLLILSVILLLAACRSKAPLSPSEPGGAVTAKSAESSTVGAVCHDALTAFESDALHNPLVCLSYRNGQADAFDITNQEAIAKIYQALASLPLGSMADDPGTLDADVVFTFVRNNGEEFTVRFVTQDYFKLFETASGEWKFYEVSDAGAVRSCQDIAMAANAESD